MVPYHGDIVLPWLSCFNLVDFTKGGAVDHCGDGIKILVVECRNVRGSFSPAKMVREEKCVFFVYWAHISPFWLFLGYEY